MWRFFRHANWNGTTCYSLDQRRTKDGANKFGIFMFIADNSIFKSIMQFFFSARSIALKEFYLMRNFEKKSFYRF